MRKPGKCVEQQKRDCHYSLEQKHNADGDCGWRPSFLKHIQQIWPAVVI